MLSLNVLLQTSRPHHTISMKFSVIYW